MRRVVITGAGIVSCIGHDLATVTDALNKDAQVLRSMNRMLSTTLNHRLAVVLIKQNWIPQALTVN